MMFTAAFHFGAVAFQKVLLGWPDVIGPILIPFFYTWLCIFRIELRERAAIRQPFFLFSTTSASGIALGRLGLIYRERRVTASDSRWLCQYLPALPAHLRRAWRATVDEDVFIRHGRVEPAGDLCGCIEGIPTASIMPAHSPE
jgi:hypothetical protein